MDQSRARSIAVDLCGLNLINQSLILDVSRLFANINSIFFTQKLLPELKGGEISEGQASILFVKNNVNI
jgi:hypothetical protein